MQIAPLQTASASTTTIGAEKQPSTFYSLSSRASLEAPMDAHFFALYENSYRQQSRDFPTPEAFFQTFGLLLANADIMVTDWHELRTAASDPNWYRSQTEPPEAIQHFYVLPLPVLKNRASVPSDMPPAPRRVAPDINLSEVIRLTLAHGQFCCHHP